MDRQFAHLYPKISNSAFRMYNQDLDTLRNKYSRAQIDLPRAFIYKMKRAPLINALLAVEYGGDPVIEYISQCNEWDDCKKFVEGKL